MSKNRTKTNLIHEKNKVRHEISREKKTGKFFIKNTDIEVSPDRLCRKEQNPKKIKLKKNNYDFDKPYHAQSLGDEWSDYAWSANDF